MKTFEFVGTETDTDGPHTVYAHFDKKEYASLPQEQKYGWRIVGEVEIEGDIQRWSPFMARYKSYGGREVTQTFCCPKCGSRSCRRQNPLFADPHFLQGNFVCSRCGAGPFNYYSDAFERHEEESFVQLTLF